MRVPVAKTYKLFVGGKFPRSESGRSFQPAGNPEIDVARASRKDVRDAVVAARAGLAAWRGSSTYLRGQILYRVAEMLESRRAAMADELRLGGATRAAAKKEVDVAVALATWYAGLCDKVQTLLGSVNAVEGPFVTFTTVEPVGVAGALAPDHAPLAGTLALALPLLAGGNAVVAVVSERAPFAGLALGEVCASSDVPAGVLNLLAGHSTELGRELAAHRDVDGLLHAGAPDRALGELGAEHCQRLRACALPPRDWIRPERLCSLAWVEAFVETKATWLPVAP